MPYEAQIAAARRDNDAARAVAAELLAQRNDGAYATLVPAEVESARSPRDAYLRAALPLIPRLLTAIDRNPFRPTYGCCDRQFWHYRTAAFPSEMYQEAALPLALVYSHSLANNPYCGRQRVGELALAALRYAARSMHGNGACDDYYPYEQALGAAVFSFAAGMEAWRLLSLAQPDLADDPELLAWLRRRAAWIARHQETGRLANHHALAALGLVRASRWPSATDAERARFAADADARLRQLLAYQSIEGWFHEYDGADPGYQTVTIDCLAKIQRLAPRDWIEAPLRRAISFARCFLHPDGSYAGEYGSRGTYHFYPAGFELLYDGNVDAAELADGFLQALREGRTACFDDDRLIAHRLGNLLEAWLAAASRGSAGSHCDPAVNNVADSQGDAASCRRATSTPAGQPRFRVFQEAGLVVFRSEHGGTWVSAARGGAFKHFAAGECVATDAGLVAEFSDGRVAVSQLHDRERPFAWISQSSATATDAPKIRDAEEIVQAAARPSFDAVAAEATIEADCHWAKFETVTPYKQAVLHLGMCWGGRWFRPLVRWLLQRRLITGRRQAPLRMRRTLQWRQAPAGPRLRVIDDIYLAGRRARVTRLSYGVDHQSVYVAASGVYQASTLEPWTDLTSHLEKLNSERHVRVVRDWL